MRSTFSIALIISTLAAASCGGDASGPPKAGPPTGITAVNATFEGSAGQVLATPLSAKVVDAQGRPVPNARVNFLIAQGGGTLSAAADTTDAEGVASVNWTVGTELGAGRAEARVQGVLVPAVFNVNIKAAAPASLLRVSNVIGSSAAGFELSDSVQFRVADPFGNPVEGVTVNFAAAAGSGAVSPASAVTNAAGVARAAWTLGAGGTQTLNVSAGTIQTSLSASATPCTSTQLSVGEAASIQPGGNSCLVLGSGQRYYVSIVNSSNTIGATSAFRMRGLPAGTAASTASSPVQQVRVTANIRLPLDEEIDRSAHSAFVKKDLQLFRELLRAQQMRPQPKVQRSLAASAVPNVGDMIDLKFPNIAGNLCTSSTPIRGRVLYVGAHSIVVEDSASSSSGGHDATFVAAGQEFDTHMWNLLNANFGNPLAVDASRNNDGRMYLVFTPRVNSATAGSGQLWGFVTAADFFPTICTSSNNAEVFYARVPETNQATTSYLAEVRRVIMHEAKHIVSYAEKLARNPQPAALFGTEGALDVWVEEGTAMLAEEIWGRSIYGYTQRSNVNYRSSIYCERRASPTSTQYDATCDGKPVAIFDHFAWLYDYMASNEAKTPIGPIAGNDGSHYGSAWSFLRWLIDHYTLSEGDFLKALTADPTRVGIANVSDKMNTVPFTQLLEEWALAMALDDFPGFTPANAKYTFPSWNMRDIYQVLNGETSSYFQRPYPLNIRQLGFGKFTVDIGSLQASSMAVLEITGTTPAPQMIELRGLSGANFPAEARVRVMRVQ